MFQVVGERVVSGSYDHLVKVWALASGECLRTLAGHQEPVLTVAFDDDKIISGAADKTIKVGGEEVVKGCWGKVVVDNRLECKYGIRG